MNGDAQFSARAIVMTVGLLLLAAALPSLIERGYTASVRAMGPAVVGALLVIVALTWPLFAWTGLTAAVGSLGVRPGVWLFLFLLLWAFTAANTTILLRQRQEMDDVIKKDILPFRLALERWVIPRRLTPDQITSIKDYLSHARPFTVTLNVKKDDEEAAAYADDIQRALKQGGWTVLQNRKDDLPTGLTTDYRQTDASARLPDDDPRAPKPNNLLRDALRQAGVQTNGNSTGGGINVTQDALSINVGVRRRDGRGDPQRWPF
jgi:hypothetical protein